MLTYSPDIIVCIHTLPMSTSEFLVTFFYIDTNTHIHICMHTYPYEQ
jgi:hypothetical protein